VLLLETAWRYLEPRVVLSTINSTYNGANASIIQIDGEAGRIVGGVLPKDIPDTGTVRVRNATTLLYNSYTYTTLSQANRNAAEFPLQSDVGATALTAAENVYVPLIEQQATSTSVSKSINFSQSIDILARVRIKGILPFEAPGTVGSSGATVSAIRSFDSIVN